MFNVSNDSIYGRIYNLITNPKVLRVALSEYECRDKGLALARVQRGETTKSSGQGIDTSARLVSNHKDSCILTILFDSSSRDKNKDRFGCRTRTIASISQGKKLGSIFFIDKVGESWKELKLNNLPIFPKVDSDDHQKIFELLLERQRLEWIREFVGKDRDNIKRKIDKSETIETDGVLAWFEPASGVEDHLAELIDGQWERVKTESYETTNNVRLIVRSSFPIPDRQKDINQLPLLMQRYEVLGDQIEEINRQVRPFELGLIERAGDPSSIVLGTEMAKIEWYTQRSSDLPADTAEKIKSGEYQMKPFAKKNGRWCNSAVVVEASI